MDGISTVELSPQTSALMPDFCRIIPKHEGDFSSSEVRNWLRSKQGDYIHQLMVYGKLTNYGYEMNRIDHRGEFTGSGLCGISSGVLEKVLNHRYGDKIELAAYIIKTDDMDSDVDRLFDPKSIRNKFFGQEEHDHTVLRFRVRGEEDWYTIDATYRQLQIAIQPHRMLMIFPTENEKKLYTYNQKHEEFRQTDPVRAESYKPLRIPPGKLFRDYVRELEIKAGKNGVQSKETIDNYRRLFIPFWGNTK